MDRQIQEAYTNSKFREFQQELIGLMYCDIIDCVGSLYGVGEQSVDGNKRSFKFFFEKDESTFGCSYLKFESAGLMCKHAI